MTKPNRLYTVVKKTEKLPDAIRIPLISKIFGQIVPMVGTGGIRYEHISLDKVVCTIRNKRPMQNHIKGLHAVAMALLAETATGFAVGVNLPDDKMPLIKTLKMDYKRLAKGDMQAVATLTPEQREQIVKEPKGEVLVSCVITDSSGQSPVEAHMVWAWVTKRK